MKEALQIENLHFSYLEKSIGSGSWERIPESGFLNRLGLSHIMQDDLEKEIISGLNLSLNRGETLCIAGASGQGKSVLLRLIAGLERPRVGTFYYFGEHLSNEKHTPLEIAQRGVGMVFQNGALISNLRVRDNVAMPLRYHKVGANEEIEEKVNMALDLMRVRTEEHQFPHMLSTGMQKRVAIARSWAMDPKLLLMDEPTAGLDNYNRRNLIPLIDNMRTLFKTSIIIVTHDLLIAKELHCNICFLRDKKLTEPHSFDYWLHSDEPIAQELFRDLRET
jgi:phospholipid/cholesterol/gamma-HCH transport system ATP-binding protein